MNINPTESALPEPVVAQVIETLDMGGAENLAVRIANDLSARGVESHLIIVTEPGILSARIDPTVRVHYLHFHRASIKNPIAFLFSIWAGVRQISGLIRKEGIGLVQTHLPGSNFWGLALEILGTCHVLATIHNNQEFKYGDTDSPIRWRFRRWAYQGIVKKCAGIIAVSQEVKNSLVRDLHLGPAAQARVTVVTNGVAVPERLTEVDRREVRGELGIAEKDPLVLAAGRFGPQKNFGDLVSAAAHAARKGYDFRMVIAGEGEELEALRARVKNLGLTGTVSLPGNLQNLNQVMLAADVFVMTSLWEGLPLVLLEAMAAGLPAVAYSIPGVTELVEDNKSGFLAPVSDPEELAEKISRLLANPDQGREMGSQARQRIKADFNFDSLVDKLVGKYLEILEIH